MWWKHLNFAVIIWRPFYVIDRGRKPSVKKRKSTSRIPTKMKGLHLHKWYHFQVVGGEDQDVSEYVISRLKRTYDAWWPKLTY